MQKLGEHLFHRTSPVAASKEKIDTNVALPKFIFLLNIETALWKLLFKSHLCNNNMTKVNMTKV